MAITISPHQRQFEHFSYYIQQNSTYIITVVIHTPPPYQTGIKQKPQNKIIKAIIISSNWNEGEDLLVIFCYYLQFIFITQHYYQCYYNNVCCNRMMMMIFYYYYLLFVLSFYSSSIISHHIIIIIFIIVVIIIIIIIIFYLFIYYYLSSSSSMSVSICRFFQQLGRQWTIADLILEAAHDTAILPKIFLSIW